MNQLQPKTIKWGIIGLGKIAHKFAADLINSPNTELYAVASRSQDKATTFAKKFNALKAYGNYQMLVNNPDIDAVYIATPHAVHKENTMLCLNKGIAVLCEKPLAMTAHDVETMVNKATQKNVLFMEALWTAFLPHYQYVQNIIKDRTYGKLLKLEANFGFYRAFDNNSRVFNKQLGGGSLLDIGIYPILAALSTLGIPNNIEASATFFDNGADSSCNMVFHYNDTIKAYLKSSLLEDLPTQAVFYCQNATIRINTPFHAPTTVTVIKDKNEKTFNFGYTTNGYSFEIQHFNNLIRDKKTQSDIMSFDFSKSLIKTMDHVRNIIKLDY